MKNEEFEVQLGKLEAGELSLDHPDGLELLLYAKDCARESNLLISALVKGYRSKCRELNTIKALNRSLEAQVKRNARGR